jgi:DNA polymerase-3 subunit delta
VILFLHGVESLLTREKVRQIREKALQQGVDALNQTVIDGETAALTDITAALQAAPFLAPQRLVTIVDFLTTRPVGECDQLVQLLEGTSDDILVVIVEYGKPDMRRAAVKRLGELAAKTWNHTKLDDAAVGKWVSEAARERGITLQASQQERLLQRTNSNLWMLSRELDKLRAHDQITDEVIDSLVLDTAESDVFSFVDRLGERKPKEALQELRLLLDSGEDPLRLLGMIIRQYRLIIAAKSFSEEGGRSQDLPRVLGEITRKPPAPVHRFVAEKAAKQAEQYSLAELKTIHSRLVETDRAVKTGKIDQELALELFTVEAVLT